MPNLPITGGASYMDSNLVRYMLQKHWIAD